jgi:glycosyl-4,4'-diaponeurosporenoate acyltransferase
MAAPLASAPEAVLSSAALWLLSSLLVGLGANRLPEPWLQERRWLGRRLQRRPGGPAAGGASPDPLGVRVWKRWLPDAGAVLPGGVAKASLVRRDAEALERLVVETRRAELVHWALWPIWLVTPLWLPPAGVLLNLLFACLFNLPCLLVQRHNRRRLEGLLGRLALRAQGGG